MGGKFRVFLLGGVSALALLSGGAADAAPVTFGFTGAIETGTITQSGTYKISAGGATGGAYSFHGAPTFAAGIGAFVSGYAYLAAGTQFSLLVGGNGSSAVNERGGGGGGLSYFNIGNDAIVDMIAGGGGGGGYYGAGGDGRAGTNGGDGGDATSIYVAGHLDGEGAYVPPTTQYVGYGGTGGEGGLGADSDGGGGGAGVSSNGGHNASALGGTLNGAVYGGQNASGAWAGGSSNNNVGGFGGGGGGGQYGGGGGGGFSGGGGSYYYGGGGGGSYLSGLFSSNTLTTGGATSGAFVSYELVFPAAVPLPSTLGMLGVSALALTAASRRQRKKAK